MFFVRGRRRSSYPVIRPLGKNERHSPERYKAKTIAEAEQMRNEGKHPFGKYHDGRVWRCLTCGNTVEFCNDGGVCQIGD